MGTLLLVTGCFEEPAPPPPSMPDDSGSTVADTMPTTTGVDDTTGPGPATTADPSTGPDPTDTLGLDDTTTTGDPPLPCVDGVLDPLGAGVVQESTAPGGDDDQSTCGGAGSPDLAFQWDVPYDGFFVLDTDGSDFDTVLYVLEDCGGSELSCSDNAEGTLTSEIVAPFTAGQRVVVVVDGNAGETGNAVLNINPVECPSADLSGQRLPATFSNVGGSNDHGGACGGDGNPERSFRYQAPAEGLYAFRVDSDDFQPVVYVEAGPVCGGQELGCNPPGFGRSEVMRSLAEGDYVTVVADSTGGTGDFQIDVVQMGASCPEQPLAGTAVGDINDHINTMSTSCAPPGYQEGAVFYPYADATFSWTSPGKVGTNSGCEIIVSSGFPVALSLQQGTCDGPEVQCETGTYDMATNTYQASVGVGHIPPTDFTVSLTPSAAPFSWPGGPGYTVEVQCFAVA